MAHSARAVSISEYAAHVVPGLLQTRAYARAVLSLDPALTGAEQLNERVCARLARQDRPGVTPAQLTTLLTDRLPSPFRARPARVLAYRLRETPLPAPPPVHPLQTCDSCDRAFRVPTPRLCPACHRTRTVAAA